MCFHLKPGSYDTAALITVLEEVKAFYAGEPGWRRGWDTPIPRSRCGSMPT